VHSTARRLVEYCSVISVGQDWLVIRRGHETRRLSEWDRGCVFGGAERFQNDPYWRDHLLFYEYFHGDNGAGIGASHQTAWTQLVTVLVHAFGHYTAADNLSERRSYRSIRATAPLAKS
jgi:hypothetical protein